MKSQKSHNTIIAARQLYRFQPIPKACNDRLSSLKDGEVWFSDPAKFNDLLDMKPNIRNLVLDRWCDEPQFTTARRCALACLLANPAMYQGALLIDPALLRVFQDWVADRCDEEWNWDQRLSAAIETRIAQFGVVCLTPQWDSRLMWAHYANDGQGFCIEYEVDWGKQQPNFRYVPVVYASETPSFCISEAMFTPHQFLQRVMASKHSDWAYEQEVRLVCLNAKGQYVKVDPEFVRITALIAGYAMPCGMQSKLQQVANHLRVESKRMVPRSNGQFDMESMTWQATGSNR